MQAGVPGRPRAAPGARPALPDGRGLALVFAGLTAATVTGPKSPSGSAPTLRWRTATAGPRAPCTRTAQVGATPLPCTCLLHASCATSAGIACHVAASTAPVAGTWWRFCHLVTAAAVNGPESPSGAALTRRCTLATAGPTAPRPGGAQGGDPVVPAALTAPGEGEPGATTSGPGRPGGAARRERGAAERDDERRGAEPSHAHGGTPAQQK